MRLGRPLDETFISVAKAVGVASPERKSEFLMLCVFQCPTTLNCNRRRPLQVCLTPDMIGLTLGFIQVSFCPGYGRDARLLSHEFRHVFQYEQAGSIASFLSGIYPAACYGWLSECSL